MFGIALYLFVAVRAAPAQPPVAHDAAAPVSPSPPIARVDPPSVSAPKQAAPVTQPAPTPLESGSGSSEPSPDAHTSALEGLSPFKAGGKVTPLMDAANRAYDKGDYDEARQAAAKVLAQQPGNERMLRIMVSSACIEGDSADAQKYYNLLPARDRSAMRTRCERYGVSFADPAGQ